MSTDINPANTVQFGDFCALLHKIQINKRSKQEQYKLLSNFINDYRSKAAGKKNSSIYPILRLLLPKEERERTAYNLKEKKLADLLIKVLSLSKASKDAEKLRRFTSVQNAQDSDFAGVAYFVIKNRIGNNPGCVNIGVINDLLDKVASAEVGNKAPILDEVMSYALKNLSADQMKWFLRIILKDLKLGMGLHRVLAAFHPDAPELFDNCGNLSKVCEELDDGETRPPEMGIQLFYAVCPMLSERLDIRDVANLPSGNYQIEPKFDGERFQMHMQNGKFEYFSRKGYSWSDTYGQSYESGLLTPYLKDCFIPSLTSFILDGEMMGWHKSYKCFGSKGMSFDIKKITENSKFRPCFCAFDVLYYNGKSLVGPAEKGGVPLKERLKLLDDMFTDIEGVICHSKTTIVNNISVDILEALNKAILAQDEGIVVKETGSYYIANRRNAGWYKVKPEPINVPTAGAQAYPRHEDVWAIVHHAGPMRVGGLHNMPLDFSSAYAGFLTMFSFTEKPVYTEGSMTDLDVAIIGADEAENKRQGRAKSFHVAVADRVAPGATPHRWVCVGRVSTGLSYEERERVCTILEKHWTATRRVPPPQCLVFNKEKPDFWVMPEKSIALTVRATELIRSTNYGASFTLRFPRVVRVRDDKPINDVMTLDEYNLLSADKTSVSKLGTKRINEDQISDEMKVRKKRGTKVIQVAEQFRTKPVGDVEVTSQALRGRKIHILSDDEDCKKPELIRIIESHGGKHVENIGPDTWCCIAGTLNYRIKNFIKAQNQDIISTAWLRALPNSETPCSLSPLDMLSIKKTTKLNLSREYDPYGDSYTEPVDEEKLRKLFEIIEKNEPAIFLTNEEMLSLDKELFGDNNPFSFLRPCHIHFVSPDSLNVLEARFFGANQCDIQSPDLTHVVVPNTSESEETETLMRINNVNAPIVSEDWLLKCFEERKLLSESEFIVQ